MKTPDPRTCGGLWLPVCSEPWEKMCNNLDCEGSGTCDNDTGLPFLKKCPACHGTGTVEVRLVGWVNVQFYAGLNNESMPLIIVGIPGWQESETHWNYGEEDLLTPKLTDIPIAAAYRNNTLPASVREYLEEEIVE